MNYYEKIAQEKRNDSKSELLALLRAKKITPADFDKFMKMYEMEQEISYIARMDLAGAADESDKRKKAELEKKVAALKSELSRYRNSKEEKKNGTTYVSVGSKSFQYSDDSTSSIESAQREMESYYRQELNRLTEERNRITREIDDKIRRIGEDKDKSTKKLYQEYKKAYAYERG